MVTNVLYLGRVAYARRSISSAPAGDAQGRPHREHAAAAGAPAGHNPRPQRQAGQRLAPPEFLAQRGVELFEIDRGGDVTFHGPGQLVAYPIFDLRSFEPKVGAVEYVRRLEEVLIRTCGDFGIGAQRIKGLTGVWTYAMPKKPEAKIAAIGVHISRSVTTHGFALNVSTDLDFFSLIVPCGITDKPVTSMQRELQKPCRWKKLRPQRHATSAACSIRRCCGWSRWTICSTTPPPRHLRIRTLPPSRPKSFASCTAMAVSWRNAPNFGSSLCSPCLCGEDAFDLAPLLCHPSGNSQLPPATITCFTLEVSCPSYASPYFSL